MRAVVVVPARDEEERIGACLHALAAQEGVAPFTVLLVLDACTDATAERAQAVADSTGLTVELVVGPGRGVGHARGRGMAVAAARLRGGVFPDPSISAFREHTAPVIASTDADSVVAPDWLARTLAAVDAGAAAVGGRIVLDAEEASALDPAVLRARAAEAERRLAAVRVHVPNAEHHQFSGASLALTLAAYDAVGGLPAVSALEDEALERALRAAGLPIAYPADVRVTTSARTQGHVPRGLAQVLRTASWRAASAGPAATGRGDGEAAAHPADGATARSLGRGTPRARGDAVRDAVVRGDELVVVLGPGVSAAAGAALAAVLRDDPELQLVRAAEPHPDPLAELVARPALNLHAPELAVLSSPLTRTWAARRSLLARLALPHGDAADLTVLVDTWRRHGLRAIAERSVEAPPPAPREDAPLAAYELLAALAARFPEPPALSSAFADPAGTRRARLDEHPPTVSADEAPDGGARSALSTK